MVGTGPLAPVGQDTGGEGETPAQNLSRVDITTALALIDLSPEELDQAAATRISARRPRRILNELHRIGWTDQQLASWLTGSDLELATSRAFYCTRLA